jgi:hypothetical protein
VCYLHHAYGETKAQEILMQCVMESVIGLMLQTSLWCLVSLLPG